MSAFFWCVEVLATAVEGYLGISVVETLGVKRYYGNVQMIAKLLVTGVYTAVVSVLNTLNLFSWITTISALMLITVGGIIVSTTKPVRALAGTAAYIVILALQEGFLLGIIGYFQKVPIESLIYRTGYTRCVYLLIDKLIDCCLYLILYRLYQKKKSVDKISTLSYATIIVLGFLLLSLFVEVTTSRSDSSLQYIVGICGVVILICLFAVTQYLYKAKVYRQEQLANQKLQAEARITEEKYSQLYQTYQESSKNFHDFRNHLTAIDSLILHGKDDEAREYIQHISCSSQPDCRQDFTGTAVIDAVLNDKMQQAEKQQTVMRIDASLPQERDNRILQPDLCVILANLLDNALEACRKIPEPGDRFIDVKIHPRNEFLIFRIANTVLKNPFQGDGTLKTTKDNPQCHGIGLQSVRSSAEKYDGKLFQTYQDNQFISVVIVSYRKAKDDAQNC